MNIILVNGTPKSGKTTQRNLMASIAQECGVDIFNCAVSDELKRMTHRFYGAEEEPGTFELEKDLCLDAFWGSCPRNEYIWMYEKVLVPRFGRTVLAKLLRKQLLEVKAETVIAECGLQIEAEALVGPKDKAVIIQYHNGKISISDYREYIDSHWPVIPVQDAHLVEDMHAQARKTWRQAQDLLKAQN